MTNLDEVVECDRGSDGDAWRREPEYFERATVLDAENCMSVWLDATPHDSMAGKPLIQAARNTANPPK